MKDIVAWILGILAMLLLFIFHALIAYLKIGLPIWASIVYGIAVVAVCCGICLLLNKIFNDKE